MKVFANLNSLFPKDRFGFFRRMRSKINLCLNKEHRAVMKEARTGLPLDEGYLLDLEYAKISEMLYYQEKTMKFEGVERVIRDMRICLSLLEIIRGNRNLFHMNGDLVFVEPDEETRKEHGEDIVEVKTTPDFEYVCDVYVNTKNISRFVPKEKDREFYEKYLDELYILKARHLYHKIRAEREAEWWY